MQNPTQKQKEPQTVFALLNHELEPKLQRVEMFSEFQIPSFHIVGLASTEVSESKERIRAAFSSSGLEFPKRRVVLNLSPADVKKQGTGTDLALGLSVFLASAESRRLKEFSSFFAWGELGLNGDIRPCGHSLRALVAALKSGAQLLVFSTQERASVERAAALIGEKQIGQETRILFIDRFEELSRPGLSFQALAEYARKNHGSRQKQPQAIDDPMEALSFQEASIQAVRLALAGGFHTLIIGPKGTGKTSLIDLLSKLFAHLKTDTHLDSLLVRELRNPDLLNEISVDDLRSIRRVDVTIRPQALVGGIYRDGIVPGEFSLASGGLLLADEFAEWNRDCREVLRSPLETGQVILNRSRTQVALPARFQMIATANECPCGAFSHLRTATDRKTQCLCSFAERGKYQKRISGPLLDRFGIVIRLLPHLPAERISFRGEIQRVETARARLTARYGKLSSQLSAGELETLLAQHPAFSKSLQLSGGQSLRRRHHLVRIALTLAALENASGLDSATLSHAKSFLASFDSA